MAEKAKKLEARDDYPEYASLVGLITIKTAKLDWNLGGLFARMVDLPIRHGRAVYLAPQAAQARYQIIKNTADAVFKSDPKMRERIHHLANRCRELIDERHRLVHDLWEQDDDEESLQLLRMDHYGRAPRNITIQDLERLNERLDGLYEEVMDMRTRMRKRNKRKHRERSSSE